MRRKSDTMSEMKEMAEKMLDDTARTVDRVRYDIEKTIVDYTFVPGKDIIETDDSIMVHITLPGIKKEDIDLKITEKRLKVQAKFDWEHRMGGAYITLADKRSGYIKRTVRMPKKVIPEEAKASFENGILKVEVPKLDKEESISVEIE